MPAAIQIATLAIQLLPQLIAAGVDISGFVEKIIAAINAPAGPTDADWQALHDMEAKLRAALQQPLPAGS